MLVSSNRMRFINVGNILDRFTTSCNDNISCCLCIPIFELIRLFSVVLFENVIGRIITSAGFLF